MQEVLQGLHTLCLFFYLHWGLSLLFFIFFSSSLMPKMVPLVLQILIPNANRMCQVQGDVNGKLIEEQRVGLCYPVSSAWILKQKPATDLLPLKSPSTRGTQSWAAQGGAQEFFWTVPSDWFLSGGLLFQDLWCTARTELLPFPRSRPDPNTAPGDPGCKVLSSSSFQGNQSLWKGQAATSCRVPVNPLQPGVAKTHSWPLSCEQELLELLAHLTMQSTWSDQWILLLYLFHKLPSDYDAVQITCCRCFMKKGISSALHNNYL